MRILVCGSRHFNDYEAVARELQRIGDIGLIIHGAAQGADTCGERYAMANSIPMQSFPADWERYGKSAGPIRNRQMLKEGAPDLVVAFRGPNSRGTQDMINAATKAGIPVEIINVQ